MRSRRELWIHIVSVLSAATYIVTIFCAAATLVSIAAAQILLGVGCLMLFVIRPRPFCVPAYVLPLIVFLQTTLISLAMSPEPLRGWAPIRKFVLVAIGLLAANFVNDAARAKTAYRLLIAIASVEAMTSFVQFALKERHFLSTGALRDDPMALDRVKGFMGHWMTFSGGQLLVWCAAIPVLVLIGRRWMIPLSFVGVALIFSYTRSAWIGAGAGFLMMAPWVPKKLLVSILIPIVIVALLATPLIYHRYTLSAQGQFGPDYGRAALLKAGLQMVEEHPWFGVGLERIPIEFPHYYPGDSSQFYFGHMQNDFMQIAAERGLLCFAAFLWLLAVLFHSLFRFTKASDQTLRLTAISALAALTGFLVMGLFEYNFGDSEPFMLFMFLISIPFGIDAAIRRQKQSLP
jgi:O-antigen ligase